MIVVAIICVITYSSSSVMYSLMKVHVNADLGAMILTTKAHIVNCLEDPKGIVATILDPVNSGPTTPLGQCLAVPSTCYPLSAPLVSGRPIKVNGSMSTGSPSIFYGCEDFDTSLANSGFTRNGSPCSTFSLINPDPNCPFKYSATWKPLCIDINCKNPQIVVSAELQSSAKDIILNLDSYRFEKILSKNTNPVEEFGVALVLPSHVPGGKCKEKKWNPRVFNTIVYDTNLSTPAGANTASLTPGNGNLGAAMSAQVFLAPGKYGCRATAYAFQVGNHQVRLKIVDSTGVRYAYGTNARSSFNFGFQQTESTANAAIDLGTGGFLALEHYCEKSLGAFDFGRAITSAELDSPGPNIFNSIDCIRYE